MSDLEELLASLQAKVDQLGAEIGDPATTEQRKDEIFARLEMLYEVLVEFKGEHDEFQ